MDLIKARARAKQKALENGKPETGLPETPELGRETPEPVKPVPRKADKKPRGKPAAVKAPAKAKLKPAPAADPVQAPAESGPAGPPAAPPFLPPPGEEAFEDTAFGEDLPGVGLADSESCDMLVGEVRDEIDDAACAARARSVPSAEEDISFEVKAVPAPKAAAAPSREKPAPPPAPPPKPRDGGAPARPLTLKTSSSAERKAPAETATKKVERTALTAAPAQAATAPKAGMDWEESEPGWSVERETDKEDDFFSLVTEDLYLREFGKDKEEAGSQLELLSFRLANEVYAVRLTSIKQIIKMTPITVVPRAPNHVLGIISLRGTIIPVFDLRRILHLPMAPASRKTRIMIVAEGKFMAGLIVDEVEHVVRLPESGIEPPPPVLAGVEAEYIEGIGRSGTKMMILLALVKIMVPVKP